MPGSNIAFLNELLHSIGARISVKAEGTGRSSLPADQRLADACTELMRHAGEALQVAVARDALDAYGKLDRAGQADFFRSLLTDYSADPAAIRSAFGAWDKTQDEADLEALFRAVEPRRQTLLRRLNFAPGGTLQLVRMRADLLGLIREAPELRPLDADFGHLLASWFNRGFLVMRRIDWNTPAAILEKIVAYEAVHEIRDWDDLRRRLDPADRRCYGFFHPATGDEPLIFVEVALCRGIPDAIGPLLSDAHDVEEGEADSAVFYSISNCQPGLKGVSFGNFLIKQVVRDLSSQLPGLKNFVTLSPAPEFSGWLSKQTDPAAQRLSNELAEGGWQSDDAAIQRLAPQLHHWAARYFTQGKTASGAPVDPVARFHLGNGASAHRVNWPADLAAGALSRAHGVMINYLYEPERIEAQHEAFVTDGTVTCGPDLKRALRSQKATAE
jgi:malonyl-CoA decarboxylase